MSLSRLFTVSGTLYLKCVLIRSLLKKHIEHLSALPKKHSHNLLPRWIIIPHRGTTASTLIVFAVPPKTFLYILYTATCICPVCVVGGVGVGGCTGTRLSLPFCFNGSAIHCTCKPELPVSFHWWQSDLCQLCM